jgi:hypothetical protein
MKRIQWYVARASAMSVPEVIHRIRETGIKQLSRVAAPRTDPQYISWTDNAEPLGDLILNTWGSDLNLKADWQLESEIAVDKGPSIFGIRWPSSNGIPQWNAALPGNSIWPLRYCFDINFRAPENNGEVRLAWELNRLLWLVPIAATAAFEGDPVLADWCASNIESWDRANPPFRGINWASGIECALEIFALATIEDLLARVAPNQTRQATISRCISLRAKWIRRFPSQYSSANNHTLAELAGQLVAALVIKDDSDAADPARIFSSFDGSIVLTV